MQKLNNRLLPAGLFIFCALIFAGGLSGDFVMDDWPVVKENSKITEAKFIPNYFTQGVWANTDLADQTGIGDHSLYRPVFLLTLNAGYQLWGDSALGFHMLNLALHSINTVLVYFLILGFISPKYRITAGISAAIFAAHPVHVESVAWVAGMTDPLVAFFLLSGFLCHRRSFQASPTQWLYNILAPLCFSLALLSKETAIFFPVILFTYDFLYQRKTITSKAGIFRYVTYATLLLIYFILRNNALGGDLQQTGALERMHIENLPTLITFLAHYVQLLVFPTPLEYYYSPPDVGILPLAAGSLLLLGALLYLPRAFRRNHALYVLAITWGIVTLLPALPIALFSEPIFAQRVLYLPTIGLSIFIAWSLQKTQQQSRSIEVTMKTAFTALLIFFSEASISEVSDWKNDEQFYNQSIKTSPDSHKPIAGLASVYALNKKDDAAIDLYLKAAALAPRESDKIDFWEFAASIYGQNGNIDKSEALYNKILQKAPKRSSAWVGLGNNALARRDPQKALGFYQKAYEANPNNRIASYNLALVYRQLGKLELAARFQRLAQQQPSKK